MSSPVYALYARPADVKQYLGITDESDDAKLLTFCEWARAEIDHRTKRQFYPQIATRKYDYPGSLDCLWLDKELISLTTLTNGDATEITSTYYKLYPYSGPPYWYIELDESQGVIFQYSTTRQQCISVLGVWGYDEILVSSGATCGTYTANATSVTPSTMSPFAVGDLLKIESEYLYVSALGSSALTVVPAVNGSTAANHSAKTVYFVRPPEEIVRLATRMAAWRWKQKDAAFEKTANMSLGIITVPSALPVDMESDIKRWSRGLML